MSTKTNTLAKRFSGWATEAWCNDDNKMLINPYGIIILNDAVNIDKGYKELTENLKNTALKHFEAEYANYDKELEVPNLKELKAELKALVNNNRSARVVYDFDDLYTTPRVNVRYLIHLLEGLDVYKITYDSKLKPIRLYGKNGYALLMPVNYFANDSKSKGLKKVR